MCGIESLIFRAIGTDNPNRLGALLALRFSQVGEKFARNFMVLQLELHDFTAILIKNFGYKGTYKVFNKQNFPIKYHKKNFPPIEFLYYKF